MNELIDLLSSNEPAISAAVGIVTLLAACWGALLMLWPTRRDSPVRDSVKKQSVWSVLVNRGVNYRDELIDQIAGRTLNACLMVVMASSLTLVLLGLTGQSVGISITNLVVFVAAVIAYNLHIAGYAQASRWLLIGTGVSFWVMSMLMMGPRVGLEYCMGAVLLLPLLLFHERQWRQVVSACVLIVLSLPVALAIEPVVSQVWPFNEVEVPEGYYYVNVVVISVLVFATLFSFNVSADFSFYQLEDRQQKASELLHSLLPAYIAEKMRGDGETVARWHSEATVLFATVTGFENLYKKLSAVQLLELLRDVFEQFDALVAEHGVEKINTLGTNYVAACGIDPSMRSTPEDLARVALGMRKAIERLSADVDHNFGLRVGMSTGEVVSGVIGEDRPCFDIWGGTVELAHSIQMEESTSDIIVSDSTYWRLKKSFVFLGGGGLDGAHRLQTEIDTLSS